jgi:hypothetical protein
MYGDITQFPYIVFHYTPLYHLVVRFITTFGIDPLIAGRGVALAATTVVAAIAGVIVSAAVQGSASTSARIVGAAVAGLMVFTYRPIQEWAPLMRVDMLAISFSMAGVYLAIVAGRKTMISCLAVLLFVLAIYTKQTEIYAPIAAILTMLIVNVRSAIKASAFGFFIGAIAFIALQLSTGGGFWRHIFMYNLHNPYSFHQMLHMMWSIKGDVLGVLLGIVALVCLYWSELTAIPALDISGWIEAIRGSRRLRVLTILFLWFLLASAQLILLGKSGAADNYSIEWMCIATMPVGMITSLVWDAAAIQENVVRSGGLLGLLLSLALAEHALHRPLVESPIVDSPKQIATRMHLVDLIRENPKPSLSTDMVLLMRAGKPVPIEPQIFTDLAKTGTWDQRPLLNLLQDRAFGLIILQEGDEELFTTEAMRNILKNYASIEQIEDYQVRRPSSY